MLVGVKLFPNVPTEFTNDLFVSIGDSSEETKTKGRGALSAEVLFCGHQSYAFVSVHTRALQTTLLKHFETTVAYST